PSTALSLNLIVSSEAFYFYRKAGYFRMQLLLPFVLTSIPAAFLGGFIPLDKGTFTRLLALSLLLAGLRMFWRPLQRREVERRRIWWLGLPLGAILGALAGLVGMGGGVLLSPLLLLLGWAQPKEAAAVASALVFLNSIGGLVSHSLKGAVEARSAAWGRTPLLPCRPAAPRADHVGRSDKAGLEVRWVFLKTKSLEEARELALEQIKPISEVEVISTEDGLGRIVAADLRSPGDLPGFTRATMDGYAVRARDTFGASEEEPLMLRVVASVEMGQDARHLPELGPGEAVGISTGAMMPPGADAVVILEESEAIGEDQIAVLAPVAPGENVIAKDADLKRGEGILTRGQQIRPQDIGALLGAGITEIPVFARGSVGVIPTGDELVPPQEAPAPGEIRDINSAVLAAQIAELNMQATLYEIVPDELPRLLEVVERAIGENDLVLVSGGSSVGTRDITLAVIEELGEVLIHGIRIAPGKPTFFSVTGTDRRPLIGLPGNPVSSMVVFDRFVTPLLRKLSGARDWDRVKPQVRARLTANIPSTKGRQEFIRVKLVERDGRIYAQPIRAHSSQIVSLTKANGLITIPAESEGLPGNAEVTVELW
ncbi:MAG: gephyrin-like molybdotransferase Glp, partial [Candidatus Bipolaricaulia bacterium]